MSQHTHANEHAFASVFAHTHDGHAPRRSAAGDGDHGHEAAHRPTMVATPERRCEFEPDRVGLELLYRALSGHSGELIAYDDTDPAGVPETVHALHLPARAPVDEHHGLTRQEWYRVAVTHRALHHLLGSFTLDLDRPEPLFRRLRPGPLRPGSSDDVSVPSQERFSRLFGNVALGVELFVTLEDLRIDARAQRLLPGLAASYRLACHEALHDRPPLSMLPAADAVVEALVQFSLGAAGVMASTGLAEPLARVIAAARRLREPDATVESSAEAALRVYDVVAGLPEGAVHRSSSAVAFDDLDDQPDPVGALRCAATPAPVTISPVPFRDPVGARYVTGDPESGLPLEQAVLRLATAADVRADPGQDADESARQADGSGGDGAATPTAHQSAAAERPPPIPGAADGGRPGDSSGRLHPRNRDEYIYPEWDGVVSRYRQGWCRVRVSRARAVPTQRHHRLALARHGHLLPGLVAALERVRPAGRDIVRRRADGDDLDLDACVEALIDLRAGVEPGDGLFTSTQERRRDVAVGFALDLSASTAEALPPDPAHPGRPQRILDLQRDAVSLVLEALERVGDAYGIYGFSGAGRDDVRVSVVKDVDERRSPATVHRLGGLVPDHATRMGAAIRHLSTRLARHDARTKILLIVSDGRPYDIDYGQQHGEEHILDYALADTGRAMAEARRSGVWPYLVTVDGAGGDYLSRICDRREYHAIADARDLPRSLADLYVVARTDALRRPAMIPG